MPFWWSSTLPMVFLPSRFGLITTLSRLSRLPYTIYKTYCTYIKSFFSSSSASLAFDYFISSFICFSHCFKWLLSPFLSAFLKVTSFKKTALGSDMSGNWREPCLPLTEPGIWKLILKYVHYPYSCFETVLTVLMWNGTNYSELIGSKIVSFFSSTYRRPGFRSLGNLFIEE